jgi:hypothetical protein
MHKSQAAATLLTLLTLSVVASLEAQVNQRIPINLAVISLMTFR